MSEATWGFEGGRDLDRLLVVSPHLDDAVMSCGALLLAHPGATVVTMFAASPAEYSDPLNEHDQDCGFRPGDDTMAVRRDEDVRALEAVGARARRLELCQHSHIARLDPIAVPPGAVDALTGAIAEAAPTAVVAPLGLLHPDHQACHATALAVRERAGDLPWLWYSDLPYAYIPRVLAARFRALHAHRITATPACPAVSHDFDAKWRAFGRYATQVGPLDRQWRLRDRLERGGEFYWTLDRDQEGAERYT
jgi:LmbE family N-acetylglucosaminyl deacetylase